MTSPPIYTALNVPTVTSYPSPNCLQWSADGQICFATKTAAYIMTPDHGIHFDTTSTIRSIINKENRDDIPPLGWFRTIIPFDKTDVNKWPDYSQAYGAASLGSIDVSLWAVAFSPSNISPDAGCILAALTSNMDLTLWTAAKNCLKGEWVKVYEVTPFLIQTFPSDDSQASMTAQALNAQVISIAWSQQADFGHAPTPMTDGSLLALGNRAGSIIFLRYRSDQTIEHVHTFPILDQWVTHLAFSSWTLERPGTCKVHLAYAGSDGSVGIITIIQALGGTCFIPDIHVSFENTPGRLHEAGKSGTTALSWVEGPGEGCVLVNCKPGVLHLWSLSSGWSGYRYILLQTQKLSTSSSSLHPVSGIHYIQRRDILIVTLFDGSLHAVHSFLQNPSLVPRYSDDPVTSEALSVAVRQVFAQSEQGEVEYSDVNRITGLTSYDSSATFVWLHEASRPSDFSYKHDAKHNSMLMVAKVWDDTDDEAFVSELENVLNNAKSAAGLAPLHLLRPFFFRLRNKSKLNELHPRILEILKPQFADHSLLINAPTWTNLTDETRRDFRKSLTQHLFGWDFLLSLGMRLSLADFSWKLADNEQKQEECGHVAQSLLNAISHRVLRTIIRHLLGVVQILTANDMPFIFRMVIQSLLPGSPADLSSEGHNLSTVAQATVFAESRLERPTDGFTEYCPACRTEVPLQDITTAVCSNGHTWARCSITTFILCTPLVRTCIGCSRKAFLPLSTPHSTTTQNWLPEAARSWVVEELLEAVHRCLFCNNSFVSVL